MREKAALYLLFFSLVMIIGIDVTPYLIEDPSPFFIYLESGVDGAVVVLTYLLLKRELNFRTKVLHMAAHDLRNPLGQIHGFSELILEGQSGPEKNMEMVRRMNVKSAEVLQLVNDLLDSSVIDRRQVRLAPQQTSLNALVAEVLFEFESHASRKKQILLLQSEEEIGVVADPARMRQVLANLISNAIKYSPAGAQIQTKVDRRVNKARVVVADRGPGLSSGECTRIFDSFTKVKKPTTGGESSTGLGLSITKSLVELNGGKIWVESRGEGQGSTFIVELPAAQV